MSAVKLKSYLPQGESNGLKEHADKFVDDPDTLRIGIVLFDTKSTTEDRDTGQVTAIIRIRRAELVTRSDDVKALQRIMLRANEERTGKTVLPFDMENAVEDVFTEWSRDDTPPLDGSTDD